MILIYFAKIDLAFDPFCKSIPSSKSILPFFLVFLATYAAAVLFRMSDEKGGEYTKRLSQELRSTLYQRDLHNQLWNGDVPPPDLQVSGA